MLTPSVIVSGLLLAGVYALFAAGLSLQYGVMKSINWAYGSITMVFMQLTFLLVSAFGIDPLVCIFILVPVGAFAGVLFQKGIFDRTLYDPFKQLLVTFGVAFIIFGLAVHFWQTTPQALNLPYQYMTLRAGTVRIPVARLIPFLGGLACLIVLHAFIQKTWYGKAIRATSQNPWMAEILGIDIRRIHLIVSMISTACVGVAAPLLMMIFLTSPYTGPYYINMAFVITLLGGPGNILGAFFGALIIAMSETLVAALIQPYLNFIAGLVIFIVLLLLYSTKFAGRVKGRLTLRRSG